MSNIVCVASSFPEALNRNLTIVSDLADGFRDILGVESVHQLAYFDLPGQIARLRPALLVLVGSALAPACDYRALARECRAAGTTFAFWTVEDPYEFDANCKFMDIADIVFSNDAWACRFYDRERVFHLPTAASHRLARRLDFYAQRSLEVFFCGVGFPNRRAFVADALPVLERHRTLIAGEGWGSHVSGIIVNRRLSREALIDHYGGSRCVLNLGRNFSYANNRRLLPAVTPGPRTFDAAMVGCVQFCFQPSCYLGDYFEVGKEIIAFDSIDEFEVLLREIIDNPAKGHAIALAAQKRAIAEHSFVARARTILTVAGLGAAMGDQAPLVSPVKLSGPTAMREMARKSIPQPHLVDAGNAGAGSVVKLPKKRALACRTNGHVTTAVLDRRGSSRGQT